MAAMVIPAYGAARGRATVGAALSPTELCAVVRAAPGARAGVWRFPLQPLNGDATGWPALTAALNELSRMLATAGGRLDVALMPPLTEIRRLDLPPMRDDELRMLLARNASRYFVGARTAQLVGTTTVPARGSSAPGGVMAAAAPQRLVAALHAAARDAGWTVEAVSPAESAWCAAAAALWPAASRQSSHLLVCGDDRTALLQLEHGRLSGVRRFRAGALDAALVAEALGPAGAAQKAPARIAAVGVAARRQDLSRALSAAGLPVAPPPAEWAERADHPDLLAAEFAGPLAAPLLRSEATLASRREHSRRVVARMALASAALLVLAAALTFWGEKRQLRAVQAGRSAIKPQISATLVGRTSVETAFRQLAALAATQRSSTKWSGVIAELGVHLDGRSHLTSLRARDDSVVVEGVAASAARAFDSIVRTPGLSNVRAAAPVRRESPEGGPALERFTIAAVVTRPGGAASRAPRVTAPVDARPTSPATAAQKVTP